MSFQELLKDIRKPEHNQEPRPGANCEAQGLGRNLQVRGAARRVLKSDVGPRPVVICFDEGKAGEECYPSQDAAVKKLEELIIEAGVGICTLHSSRNSRQLDLCTCPGKSSRLEGESDRRACSAILAKPRAAGSAA